MSAVQSQANPAPMYSDGVVDVDDGVEFDPFEKIQERAEVDELRLETRNRGLSRKAYWS